MYLEFHPKSSDDDTLIIYSKENTESLSNWLQKIDQFTGVYRLPYLTPGRRTSTVSCDYYEPVPKRKVCDIDVGWWIPCTPEFNYNYDTDSPCIFLKLYKNRNWIPEFYSNVTELPESMPADLVEYINNITSIEPVKFNTVWISCNGKTADDKNNIHNIRYVPSRGIPGYLFDNDKNEGYVRPAIAVILENISSNVEINVECEFWTRNYHGSTEFQILQDTQTSLIETTTEIIY
ncbi:sodium/potassium-transporting ATPase subunit beta-2-like isoform X2 [Arctopsyche grandis]